ncbi:MAG: hypothetical protein LBH71_00300 [Oscillospiraceae bacterium]|jgi:hypothetical protein|nr:hypothetical protein [Oscillospiraceae bacterium]
MKKVLLLLTCCLFILSISVLYAAPQGNTYTIDDMYMKINIPEKFFVFTPGVPHDNPGLDEFELNADDLNAFMKESGIYIYALSLECELNVIMHSDNSTEKIFSFSEYSDDKLKIIADEIIKSTSGGDSPLTYYGYSLYSHKQTRFIVFDLKQEDIYTRQFYTVHNGQSISIDLRSYSSNLSDDQKDMQRGIVESIEFIKTLTPNSNNTLIIAIAAAVAAIILFVIFKPRR